MRVYIYICWSTGCIKSNLYIESVCRYPLSLSLSQASSYIAPKTPNIRGAPPTGYQSFGNVPPSTNLHRHGERPDSCLCLANAPPHLLPRTPPAIMCEKRVGRPFQAALKNITQNGRPKGTAGVKVKAGKDLCLRSTIVQKCSASSGMD